ncbi:hypothetical protein Tco_0008993 [Tanacetum coccineum]
MRALIKEEVNTQLPQIFPQAVSDFVNPVIENNVTESVEAAVLTRCSSQLTSTYEAATSLSGFELTKTRWRRTSHMIKRSRDEDKDRDPSAGSNRGKKRRKSSKDADSLM